MSRSSTDERWRPPPDDGEPGERWGWPWALAGLTIISIWLTVLGVWWFGLAPL